MTESILATSQAMADLVEQSGSAIVRVNARRRTAASGVVWSADAGLIVTAHHVVRRSDGIQIRLPDGSEADATLVGRDPSTDLALLQANLANVDDAAWAERADLRVGHLVLAVARPGHTVQATQGIFSALGPAWHTQGGGVVDHYLQTDVLMYPGFSGGALVTAGGAFAGINSSALVRGASVTIPYATVKRVVETLASHGRMPRGYLGVGLQPVRLAESVQRELGQETGLMVMSIESGSPAESAAISQGDVLISLDGVSLSQVDALQAVLSGDRVGKDVMAQVVRGGVVEQRSVVIGEAK